jgi:hypothetical protein
MSNTTEKIYGSKLKIESYGLAAAKQKVRVDGTTVVERVGVGTENVCA